MAEFKGFTSDWSGGVIVDDRVQVQIILRGGVFNHEAKFDICSSEVEDYLDTALPRYEDNTRFDITQRKLRGQAAVQAKKAAAEAKKKR